MNRTWAVGTGSQLGRGPYGHFDLIGNVYDWVRDYWQSNFYSDANATKNDPKNTVVVNARGIRGTGFGNYAKDGRASFRTKFWPDYTGSDVGIRCTRPFTACDDNNPCTIDTLAANGKCSHTTRPDNSTCGTGKTCKAGVCKAGCPTGYTSIPDGPGKTLCGAGGPVWGKRAFAPKGVLSLQTHQGAQVVVDAQTRLMWQRQTTAQTTFAKATERCRSLTLGGYDDWRLPTDHEIESIRSYTGGCTIDKTILPAPCGVQDKVWLIRMKNGGVVEAGRAMPHYSFLGPYTDPKATAYVRCVRLHGKPYAVPTQRFSTDVNSGVVVDTWTGSTWQRKPLPTIMNWVQAQTACKNLTLGGKTDWVLPHVRQLFGIIDPSRTSPPLLADPAAFQFIAKWSEKWAGLFHAATPFAQNGSRSWFVPFDGGGPYSGQKAEAFWARCVR